MTPRDHLRAAMADRRTGRLHHRGTGVTVYLFDGEIVAADAPDDGDAVIAALRGDVAVPKFAIDHVAKRIDDGADWLGALAAGIDGPPLDAALIERFRHNLSVFCAAHGTLDAQSDRTGIPVNLQQGVDLTDIIGDLPPRPRDVPATPTPSMAPPPVPKALRGATPRVVDATPPPTAAATTPKIPARAAPVAPAVGINPTVVAVVLLPILLVLVFAVSLLSGVMDGGASTHGSEPPTTAPAPAVTAVNPTPPPPPAAAPVDVPIMPDPPTPPAADVAPVEAPVAPPPVKTPPRDKPKAVENVPASHFFGEWRGTVSGRTSGVVVQVGEGTSLTGVFWTTDGTGRKEVPVTGAIKGQAVRFEGPGVALVMQVEGWQLVGRCSTPADTSATACLLVKQ